MSELFSKWDNLFVLYEFLEKTSANQIKSESEEFVKIYGYFNNYINDFADKNDLDLGELEKSHIQELTSQIQQKISLVVEQIFGTREQLEDVYSYSISQFAPQEGKYKNSIVLNENLDRLIETLLQQYNNYILVKNENADVADFESYEEFYIQSLCISYFKYLFDSLYINTVYN